MRIGIDIDDTLSKTHEEITKIKQKFFPEYGNSLLPPKIFESFQKNHLRDVHTSSEVKEGAIEALKWFHEHDFEIYIISARDTEFAYEDSLKFLEKNHLFFDKLIVKTNNKGEVCHNENITIFIDDKESVCDDLLNHGINVIKMARFDEAVSKHKTFNNWEEILKYIKENYYG